MSKIAKLLVISVVCLFLATTFVSAGILDFFTGTQDELVSGNAVRVQEKVTCVFSGGKKVAQSCSSIRGNCSGIGSCTAIVQGPWGAKDQWKSSCGGYATATMDRRNEKIEFKCGVVGVVETTGSTFACSGDISDEFTKETVVWGNQNQADFCSLPVDPKNPNSKKVVTSCEGKDCKLHEIICDAENGIGVVTPLIDCLNGCKDGACVKKEASTTISCAKELGQDYWCGTKTGWAKECSERGKVSQVKCGSGGYCVTCAVQETRPVEEKPSTAAECLVKMPSSIPPNCYTYDQLDITGDGRWSDLDINTVYSASPTCKKKNCDLSGDEIINGTDINILIDVLRMRRNFFIKDGLICHTNKYQFADGICLSKEGKLKFDSMSSSGGCATKEEWITRLESDCTSTFSCKSEERPCRMILKSVSTPCE